MANLDNDDLATWFNKNIRTMADFMAGMLQANATLTPQWLGTFKKIMDDHVTAGGAETDLVNDGSESDGRVQLTIAEWRDVITGMSDSIAQMAANDTAILKAAVNPKVPGA